MAKYAGSVRQSLAIACSTAVGFETTGQRNPLAATNFALLMAAYNIPMSYMLVVDGWGYGMKGITGAFAVDAAAGIAACVLLGLLLLAVRRSEQRRAAATAGVS